MARESRKREESIVRRATETALDVAVGGTALVADKALESVDKVVGRVEDAVAQATEGQATEQTDARTYENRTRDELYELAAEREIEGRSTMRKAELIAALRGDL